MDFYHWFFWLVIFFTGAAIGSFLNVVIYRLPRGLSLLRPPSHCPSCGVRLRPAELVPVVSWILLLGRCRHCRHRISVRYPVVEAASGLLACAAVYFNGPYLPAVLIYAVCAALLVTFFVDLDHMIIPDQVHWVIGAAGVLLDIRRIWLRGLPGMVAFSERVGEQTLTMAWPQSLVGAAVGAGLFLALGYLAQAVFRRPALGLGDVKLAAAMGALLGPGYYFISFFLLAAVLGGLTGLVVLVVTWGRQREHYLPFGPMLALSGMVMALAPEQVSRLVLARFLL
ncbi:MAG: prepilin peptidase [Armatimonadetes bacterium]|nr:prepilin peptidase [Armatimonadota bacterium]